MENAPDNQGGKITIQKPPVAPQEELKFERYESHGWVFNHSIRGMSSEKEMD